jgi:uncharacterized membrane protein
MPDPKPSGFSDNSLGAIAYITAVPAIFFLAIAPYNKSVYVRYHAWQSIMLTVVAFILTAVLSFFPVFNVNLRPFVFTGLSLPICFVWAFISIWCAVSALNGRRLRLPLIGAWAEKQSNT